jgi:hypothetical protein
MQNLCRTVTNVSSSTPPATSTSTAINILKTPSIRSISPSDSVLSATSSNNIHIHDGLNDNGISPRTTVTIEEENREDSAIQ